MKVSARLRSLILELDAHLSSFPCRISTFTNGGVWSKHCNALLRKHVFPEFTKPHPLMAPEGHESSMGWSYNCFKVDTGVDEGLSVSACELRRVSDDYTTRREPKSI